ncbi:MAG: hypothetical protein ACREA0_05595 [bacterium]
MIDERHWGLTLTDERMAALTDEVLAILSVSTPDRQAAVLAEADQLAAGLRDCGGDLRDMARALALAAHLIELMAETGSGPNDVEGMRVSMLKGAAGMWKCSELSA